MAKTTGIGERLYVDQYDLSGDVGAIGTLTDSRNQQDITSLKDPAMRRLGLLRDCSLGYTAFFDVAAGHEHPVLKGLVDSALVTWATAATLGAVSGSMRANKSEYTPVRGADGSLVVTAAAQGNGTGMEWGNLLTTGEQTFASAAATTAVDDYVPVFGTLALPSPFGLVAYLHAISLGSGTATVHVQDSADNVSFTDISGGVFTAVTGAAVQRLVIPGNVRRYLRVNVTGTFSNLVAAVSAVRGITQAAS